MARIFLVAGEPSGDRLGADLLARLRDRLEVEPIGVGGVGLEKAGLHSIFPMSDLAVMGLRDVLVRYPFLWLRMKQTAAAILESKPDLVVFIDAQVFSQTTARQLRKAGYRGRLLLYVAPSVWAWKPERATALRPLFDEVLSVLPFEPAAMQRLGGPPTTYVGHPAVGQFAFRAGESESGPLLLLPGSREGEVVRHLPMMRDIAAGLADHPRVTGFVIPTIASQAARIAAALRSWPVPAVLAVTAPERQAALADAVAAVAVSGTITLELALAGVPHVVTYVGDRHQVRNAAKYGVRFVSLPNIVADAELVPEITSGRPQPIAVIAATRKLLDDPSVATRQRKGFVRIRGAMQKGEPEAPLVDPVERLLAHLRLASGT